jgi:hypothetical protein
MLIARHEEQSGTSGKAAQERDKRSQYSALRDHQAKALLDAPDASIRKWSMRSSVRHLIKMHTFQLKGQDWRRQFCAFVTAALASLPFALIIA